MRALYRQGVLTFYLSSGCVDLTFGMPHSARAVARLKLGDFFLN